MITSPIAIFKNARTTNAKHTRASSAKRARTFADLSTTTIRKAARAYGTAASRNPDTISPAWIPTRQRMSAAITQYQKPNPAKDGYSLAARVIDVNQNEIGNSGGKQGARLFSGSKLPLPFIVNSRAVDADPLDFEYNGVKWNSNSKDCSVGAYDKGKREMDCGLTSK
jgi:hypothetical protein